MCNNFRRKSTPSHRNLTRGGRKNDTGDLQSYPSFGVPTDSTYRNEELTRILERIVEIGLRGGWAEFENTPLALPRIQLTPSHSNSSTQDPSSSDATPDVHGATSQADADRPSSSRTE